jgi:hypothetical protein
MQKMGSFCLALGLGSEGAFLGFGLEDMYCFCEGGGGAMFRFLGDSIPRLLC